MKRIVTFLFPICVRIALAAVFAYSGIAKSRDPIPFAEAIENYRLVNGFLPGLVEWLNQTTGLQVQVAAHGAPLLPGHVYVAPDDFHLGVGTCGRALLARDPLENGLRPAVSYLFRSLARNCGPAAIGVLLTGMGKDGALELKHMRDRGAWTIAQDRESSVVYGMPGEAIQLGGAVQVIR